MLKRSLTLLLVMGLFFACGDDSTSPPPTDEPPDVPAPTTSFSGPQTNDPAATPVNVMVTLASAQAALLAPLTLFANNIAGTPAQTGDSWTWTYTFTDPVTSTTVTVTVTANHQADGWYWSITWSGTGYDNWVYMEGFTSEDETNGWWKFYDPDTEQVAMSVTWEGDDISGSFDWYEGDFQAGGTLSCQMSWSESDGTTTFTLIVPEEVKYVITENTDGSGDLYFYEWDNNNWVLMFEAHWLGDGSGNYTDYRDDPPTQVTWG